MPTTEERLASLEARMQRVEDLCTLVTELRAEMTRQFGLMRHELTEVRADMSHQLAEVRADMNRQLGDVRTDVSGVRTDMNRQLGEVRTDMNHQLGEVRAEAHRDFRWIVGIQLTTMAAVIGALAGVLYGR